MQKTQRIEVLDALRGFAIMAIMLLHFIEHFIYGVYPTETLIDRATWDGLFFLFAGKSYTIFALLFGVTYAIQYQNQKKRGGDFAGRFIWRLLLLVCFATLNAAFFPGGDVLLLFAIMGIVMVLVRKLSVKWLLAVAVLFLVQPREIYYTVRLLIDSSFTIPVMLTDAMYPALKLAVDTGDFFTMVWENITRGQVASLFWAVDAGRLLQAPGLFILGMAIYCAGRFEVSDKNRNFWAQVIVGSVVASFVLFVLKSATLPAPLTTLLTMWYNIAFTGILVGGFVLLYRTDYFVRLTTPLSFYGRMSLTSYVSQSIIGSLLFFPYALNLAPVLGIAASFLTGIIVMIVQIYFSRWWFSRSKIGPLEGWWHRATWLGKRKN